MVSLFELFINYYVLAEYCTDHYGSDVSSQTGCPFGVFFVSVSVSLMLSE
jgi:hypothetical protein